MTEARRKLASRRHHAVTKLDSVNSFGDPCRIFVGIGFDAADGMTGEVFIDAAKSGSQLEATMRDAAVLVSLLLQHGVTPEEIAHSIEREAGLSISPLGAAIDHLVEVSRDPVGWLKGGNDG